MVLQKYIEMTYESVVYMLFITNVPFFFWYNGDRVCYFIQCSVLLVLTSKLAVETAAAAVWGLSFLCSATDTIQLHSVCFCLACCQHTSPSYTPSSNPRECISLAQLRSISWALPFIPGHIWGHWSPYSSVTVDWLCWQSKISVPFHILIPSVGVCKWSILHKKIRNNGMYSVKWTIFYLNDNHSFNKH